MKLHKAVKMLGVGLVLTLGLLGAVGGGVVSLPPVTLETIDRDRIPLFFTEEQEQLPYPFEPLVELTVCPEGPPTCQFKKIQQAIDAAPDTIPVYPWETPPKIPLIHILPGTYVEDLVILKNLWLKGVGRELVTLRSVGSSTGIQKGEIVLGEILRPAIFIAGSNYLGVGIEGMNIEGGLQIVGLVSGFIRNNSFKLGGISLTGALANLFIADNSIKFSFVGIWLLKVGRIPRADISVVIMNNDIHDNQLPLGPGKGIELQDSEDVLIGFNRIYKNFVGIGMHGAENIVISDNALEENNIGVDAAYSRDVWIQRNRIERNTGVGLELSDGDYIIEDNKIMNNGKDGITVWSGKVQIVKNAITNNKGSGISVNKLEYVKKCRENQVLGNRVDYADILGQPSEELRKKCEGS